MYTLAVGLQPSVVRAAVAGALASLAWLTARPRDRWYFLLLGAAALLAWNPYNVLDPGFQLSFTAVVAIFVVVPRLERRLAGYPIPTRLAAAIAVSGACALVTAPILLLQFGTLPIYSVAANALVEPVVGPLLGLALVAALLDPLAPSAAAALAWLDGWLAAYVAGCARLVGTLPGAQVSSLPVLAGLAAVGGLLYAFPRLRPPRAYRAAALVVLGLLVVVGWRLRPGQPPPPPPNGLRVTFLDVGQGDSELIQVKQGAVLVDAGPPEADVGSQLRRLGVRRLAALVLTHPHRDHVGGVAGALERVGADMLLDPREPAPGYDEREAIAAAREHEVPVVAARRGEVYRLGRLRLRVLWPDGPGLPGEDPHDHCVVVLASYGDVDALLPGDAESPVTSPLRPPPVEILKVAHHGSADPGLPALLLQLHPRIAVVSVGAHNDYGHPTASTLGALADAPGLMTYRTDLDGRVVVESDGKRIWVHTER
jgi:competence protein ComEC